MKIIESPSLFKNPDLIIPDDSVTLLVLTAIPNKEWIVNPDILDIALSYSMSGKDVVLQLKFEDLKSYNIKNILSTVEAASISISILPPTSKDQYSLYADVIVEWYVAWSEHESFSQVIYPIVPYIEYLIALDWCDGKSTELMENPSDEYSLYFKGLLPPNLTDLFKSTLRSHIKEFDSEIFNVAREALLDEISNPSSTNHNNQFTSTGNNPPFPLIFI